MSFEELELFRSLGFLDEQILKAAEQVKLVGMTLYLFIAVILLEVLFI